VVVVVVVMFIYPAVPVLPTLLLTHHV